MTFAPAPLPQPAPRRHHLIFAAALLVVVVGAVVFLAVQNDWFKSSSSTSGTQGSGVAATQTREVSSFSSVNLAGSNNVVIHVGGRQSVVVHADDNLLGHVITRVELGNLVVANTSGSFTAKAPMRVDVTVPSLTALTLTGSGVIFATGIEGPRLTVALAGSGVVNASGSVTGLEVTVAGSGEARLEQLVARDVHAVVSGSGQIAVNATRTLGAEVPGSGTIVYGGHPAQVTTSITGSGAVEPTSP